MGCAPRPNAEHEYSDLLVVSHWANLIFYENAALMFGIKTSNGETG